MNSGRLARRWAPAAVVALVVATVTALSALWIVNEVAVGAIPDSEHHLLYAQFYARMMQLGGVAQLWQVVPNTNITWPPLTYIIHGLVGWLAGADQQTVRLASLLLLPLLAWAVYGCGRRLALLIAVPEAGTTTSPAVAEDTEQWARWTGALASLLTLFSFGINGQLRQVSLDFPASVAVTLCLCHVLRRRPLLSLGSWLLMGALLGINLLTRIQSLFFLAGPLAWAVVRGLRASHKPVRLVGRVGLAAVVAAGVSAPWWAHRVTLVLQVVGRHLDAGKVTSWGDASFVGGLAHYSTALLPLCGVALLLPAIAMLGKAAINVVFNWRGDRKKCNKNNGLIPVVLWGVGGMIGYSLTVSRHPHYLVPAIVAVALLAALAVTSSGLGCRARSFVAALLVLSVALPTAIWSTQPVPTWASRVGLASPEFVFPPSPGRRQQEIADRLVPLVQRERQRSGGVYLVAHADDRAGFPQRVASYLVGALPGLAFSNNECTLAATSWHHQQRLRRAVLVLSRQRWPRMIALWSIELPESVPPPRRLTLYRAPFGHAAQLHGCLPLVP